MTADKKSILLAVLVISIVVMAMLFVEDKFSEIPAAPYLKDGTLSAAKKEALATMLDLVNLLMNWGLAVIGAAGFFLKLGVEKNVQIRAFDMILTFVIVLLAFISIFLGHLVVDKCAEMLALDQFPVSSADIRTLGHFQYIFELGAIGLFGLHVFQFFWARKV